MIEEILNVASSPVNPFFFKAADEGLALSVRARRLSLQAAALTPSAQRLEGHANDMSSNPTIDTSSGMLTRRPVQERSWPPER